VHQWLGESSTTGQIHHEHRQQRVAPTQSELAPRAQELKQLVQREQRRDAMFRYQSPPSRHRE
jgi:hypothetical protein